MGVNKDAVKENDRIRSLEDITLNEAIEYIEGTVKIGTLKGNGFVFGGTTEEYAEEYKELCDRLYESRVATYEGVKKTTKEAIANPGTSVSDYIHALLKGVDDDLEKISPTLEGYTAFVGYKIERLAMRPARVKKARLAVEEFKPIGERMVKVAYKAGTQFDPKGTLILLVDGVESGEAWTVDEYRKFVEGEKHKKLFTKDTIPFDSKEYEEVFGDE